MHPVNISLHRLSCRGARQPRAWLLCVWLAMGLLHTRVAAAETAVVDGLAHEVQQLAQAAGMPPGARVEVEVGSLDARLKLAPCARITPYVPQGARLWGRARLGLRCDEGARWNVYLPVTVKVYAQALIAVQALPAGSVVDASQLRLDEVDLAAEASPVVVRAQTAAGRTLVRALRPGQPLREADLKARQWFAAGDTVRVITQGSGFAISADGQALNPGIDGQVVKVRTEGGRVVSGRAVAERRIEVAL
jgi:flagellar basal body P-ring formation protein FlgA